MRRNHMTMLVHHRGETVHQGVRRRKIAWRVAFPATRSKETTANRSPSTAEHFCRSCHSYAAVNIDCFECHASRPETPAKSADAKAPARDEDAEHLAAFLREANLLEKAMSCHCGES